MEFDEIVKQLDTCNSTEEAATILAGYKLKKWQLQNLCERENIVYYGSDNMEQLRSKIAYALVGARLKYNALLNVPLNTRRKWA